jgi:hypothetical protein
LLSPGAEFEPLKESSNEWINGPDPNNEFLKIDFEMNDGGRWFDSKYIPAGNTGDEVEGEETRSYINAVSSNYDVTRDTDEAACEL